MSSMFLHFKSVFNKNENFLSICLLWLLLIIIHFTFVQTLLPPQYGWWIYYGWNVVDGSFLYKDIFCFLMPYYVWLTSLFYMIFGIHFMYYTVLGVFVSCLTATLLFKIVRSIVSCYWSLFICVIGATLQYSYIVYIPFDYNQIFFSISFLAIYWLAKGIQEQKNIYLFLAGGLFGCSVMMKQTGFLLSFCAIIMIIFINYVSDLKMNVMKNVLCCVFGMATAVLPGVVALIYTDTFCSAILCVFNSATVKGSIGSIFYRTFKYGISFTEIIASGMIVIYFIYPHLLKGKLIDILRKKHIFDEVYIYILFLIIAHKLSWFISGSAFFIINIFYWIIWFLYKETVFCRKFSFFYKKHMGSLSPLKKLWIFAVLIFVVVCCTEYSDFIVRKLCFEKGNLFKIKRVLVEFCFWISAWYSFIELYCVMFRKFNKNTSTADKRIFIMVLLITIFVGTSFLSSVIEETYIMAPCSIMMALILKGAYLVKLKKVVKMIFLGIGIFVLTTTITQKQVIPYSWHGWDSIGLNNYDTQYVHSEIYGLEGFTFDVATEEAYENIIDAIEIFSDENDAVFNFPHITLFNNLTHRNNGMDVVTYYFDVCPDSKAIEGAKHLYDNPPQIVIWDRFTPENWDFHEKYFRGGKVSGQRDILKWYKEVVQNEYKLVYSYNEISVWVREADNRSMFEFAKNRLRRAVKYYDQNAITEKYIDQISDEDYEDIIDSTEKYSIGACMATIILRCNNFDGVWKDKDYNIIFDLSETEKLRLLK